MLSRSQSRGLLSILGRSEKTVLTEQNCSTVGVELSFFAMMKTLIILSLVLSYPFCIAGESYFQSLYDSISQAQKTLKEVAINVNKGLKTLGHTLKFVENFIDSTVDEDCIYTCKKGRIPVPNVNHIPDANGCGSLGVFFDKDDLPRPEMVECCNEHDICYDTCNSDKELCDSKFKACLYNSCKSNEKLMDTFTFKTCKGGAKLLYTATMALGCASYKDAQHNACECVDPKSKTNMRDEF
ncbi:hypothetical protein SK128_025282 [Halocaridina rubra]|uniref:Group XIIA secretory phospholipase A2 n=1 Tax=Halocaridina rubra TaxID=373956 RepID=A0AAN8WJ14_HALRR